MFGFNGAASARSRKPCNLPTAHTNSQAVMGPRARSRGNAAIGTFPLRHIRLQWGRERALAETLQPANGPHKFTSFNGAASARSRKRAYKPAIEQGWLASMGPRARARGNFW